MPEQAEGKRWHPVEEGLLLPGVAIVTEESDTVRSEDPDPRGPARNIPACPVRPSLVVQKGLEDH